MYHDAMHVRIQGWGEGVWTSYGKSQSYCFFTITGTDPLENHKAAKPEFKVLPSLARQEKYI